MVYCLGESLLDIIITTPDETVVRPGGAMLNAAISLGRSGIDVSLISELGDDNTADLVINFLSENKINTSLLTCYPDNNTSLALAFLDKDKKPSYTFIKNYPEQRKLISNIPFHETDILLFGSLYSLDKQIRNSILSIIKKAYHSGAIIIYDPNIRNAHHLNDKELSDSIIENIRYSSIVKGSDEDFENIFGTTDCYSIVESIKKINDKALIIITLGKEGVFANYQGEEIILPSVKTDVVSTIGAGDAFNAGIINALSKKQNKLVANPLELLNNGLEYSARVCSSFDNYI